MAKKVTLEGLANSIDEKVGKFSLTIIDSVDSEWDIEFDREFSNTGISNVILEYGKFIQKSGSQFISEEVLTSYLYILLMKEFTDLKSIITNNIEQQISVMKKLVELDMFVPIVEAFPSVEVKKVLKAMDVATKNINDGISKYNSVVSELEFDNKETLKAIKG